MRGGKVYGRLKLASGVQVPIRDQAVALALEAAMGQREELARYRAAWGNLKKIYLMTRRHWWWCLGQSLGMVPRPLSPNATQPFMEWLDSIGSDEDTHGSAGDGGPSRNGNGKS